MASAQLIDMKQIEVRIMGQGYLLSCPDNGEAYLLDAVSRVDAAMCRIRDAGKVKALDRIAVLASLNLAFELSEAHTKHQLESSESHARHKLELGQAKIRHQLEIDQLKLTLAQTKHSLTEVTASLTTLISNPPPAPVAEPSDQLTNETQASLIELMQRMEAALQPPAPQPQPADQPTSPATPSDAAPEAEPAAEASAPLAQAPEPAGPETH